MYFQGTYDKKRYLTIQKLCIFLVFMITKDILREPILFFEEKRQNGEFSTFSNHGFCFELFFFMRVQIAY